jgi:DnaJ-class molecular chaperone
MVRVKPDPFYRVEGDILVCEVPLSLDEAALGTEIDIPLPGACVRMKIPAGTQPGSVFRVRGKGLPRTSGAAEATHMCASPWKYRHNCPTRRAHC